MDIFQSKVVPYKATLVGYDSNMSIASRIIPLTIFTLPYNFLTEFTVMSTSSPYNVIMGDLGYIN